MSQDGARSQAQNDVAKGNGPRSENSFDSHQEREAYNAEYKRLQQQQNSK